MNRLEASYNAHECAPLAAMCFALAAFALLSSYAMARDLSGHGSRWHLAAGVLALLLALAQWPVYIFTLERPPATPTGELCRGLGYK